MLNVGYAEAGPANGPVVILLHGWPYDIHSYVDVAPLLAAKGYRVIVPYLRGYGTTRFLSSDRMRNGQQAAIATDIIAFMDALKIDKAIVARLRLGRPDGQHRRGAVAGALQGAGLGQRLSDRQPGGRQEAAAAEGRAAVVVSVLLRDRTRSRRLREIHARFAKLIWQLASPKWKFDDATFDRSAASLRQPGSRRDRHPQLSLAARPGRRRAAV